MNLWILSQNKDFFEKCDGLYFVHTDDNIWSIYNSITLTRYGRYNSFERVSEIFKNIHNCLFLNNNMNSHLCIYEMPKE